MQISSSKNKDIIFYFIYIRVPRYLSRYSGCIVNILLWSCNADHKQNSREKWTKSCTFHFTKERDIEIIKIYRGITLTICRFIEVRAKNLETINTIVCKFLQGIQFHTQRKDWSNTTCIGLKKKQNLQQTVTSINPSAIVRSPNGDTVIDNIAGVLLGDVLAPYFFQLCQDYLFWTSLDIVSRGVPLRR